MKLKLVIEQKTRYWAVIPLREVRDGERYLFGCFTKEKGYSGIPLDRLNCWCKRDGDLGTLDAKGVWTRTGQFGRTSHATKTEDFVAIFPPGNYTGGK